MRIPGAKSAMGAAEQIISMMPPHRIYLEGFGGTGAVMLKKRKAELNIIVELDSCAAAVLRTTMGPDVTVAAESFFSVARSTAAWLSIPDLVCYLDPPYVMETRRSTRALYNYEFSDDDHRRLCAIATDSSVRARILISGYAGSLYEVLYKNWRREQFTVMTRGGPAVESVWCNFDPPLELHDARFVGRNFTDRQRIQRKAKRWGSRLMAMPAAERAAVLEHIQGCLSAPQKNISGPSVK